ncbi:hypothetical protein VNO77_22907 [Canavalia gladiata]|uniref:Uncharacterized protein n=1 Tax=Canavalia gladiata TaxID=3824 RepID=A0AAN9L3H4_CANGL
MMILVKPAAVDTDGSKGDDEELEMDSVSDSHHLVSPTLAGAIDSSHKPWIPAHVVSIELNFMESYTPQGSSMNASLRRGSKSTASINKRDVDLPQSDTFTDFYLHYFKNQTQEEQNSSSFQITILTEGPAYS